MAKRILLVDDEPLIIKGLKYTLEQEGYETLSAMDGEEALNLFFSNTVDLVLLDVMLPDGDGMDFCKILRQKTQAPVIFLTARDENDDVIKGFRSGGDDYITKPYDLNVLKARIEAQLRRNAKPGAQHPRIELPDLIIDLFSGTAELDGNECSLPQRELQILYLLASRLGSRISYHEIYEKIYGCDVEDSKNTIRVNMSRLKKHLAMDDMSTYEIASTADGEYVLRRVIF